jgi:hypothetical protein
MGIKYTLIGGGKPHGKITTTLLDRWLLYVDLSEGQARKIYLTRQYMVDKWKRHVIAKEFREEFNAKNRNCVLIYALPTRERTEAEAIASELLDKMNKEFESNVWYAPAGFNRGKVTETDLPYGI